MTRSMIRGLVIGGTAAIIGLSMTSESRGFFNYLQRRYNAAAAMYAGTTCNPSGQQLVCSYVPQTCYRVQYAAVPVTTYRPVTGCDPCSGCPTTCMRPVTTYVQQAQYVPYTTYRLQYSVAQPACPSPATTTYYAPVAAPVAPAGCSSCGTGAVNTTYNAPSVGYPTAGSIPTTTYGYSAAPSLPSSVTSNYTPSSSTPSYSGPSYYAAPGSYGYAQPAIPGATTVVTQSPTGTSTIAPATPTYVQPQGSPTPAPAPNATGTGGGSTMTQLKPIAPHETMKPIPDPNLSEPQPEKPMGPKLDATSTPRLFDPQDKTAAAWPVERAWGYSAVGAVTASRPAALPVVHTTVQPAGVEAASRPATLGQPIVPRSDVDADGWRAMSR